MFYTRISCKSVHFLESYCFDFFLNVLDHNSNYYVLKTETEQKLTGSRT